MRPSSTELLMRIAQALDEQVLPAIADDKWAASVVRSATTLLAHLTVRVEQEAPILLADNEDAHAVLSRVASDGVLRDSHPALHALALDTAGPATAIVAHDVAALEIRNRGYQAAIERLLRALYDSRSGDTGAAEIRQTLRQYLKRRMARERDLYFPAFIGPPF